MAILDTFVQQPADRLDYDINYAQFLTDGDTVVSAEVELDVEGLELQPPLVVNGVKVKIFVTGGVSGMVYKVTVTATTELGRVKQDEIRLRIKDY